MNGNGRPVNFPIVWKKQKHQVLCRLVPTCHLTTPEKSIRVLSRCVFHSFHTASFTLCVCWSLSVPGDDSWPRYRRHSLLILLIIRLNKWFRQLIGPHASLRDVRFPPFSYRFSYKFFIFCHPCSVHHFTLGSVAVVSTSYQGSSPSLTCFSPKQRNATVKAECHGRDNGKKGSTRLYLARTCSWLIETYWDISLTIFNQF